MSWSFKVGDRVVYLGLREGARPRPFERQRPVAGHVYTIREIAFDRFGNMGLYLIEVVNPPFPSNEGVLEPGFYADCFRPLVSEGMKTLQGLLAPSPAKSPEHVS